jgi:hypothetical protein
VIIAVATVVPDVIASVIVFLFATLAGSFGAFFHRRGIERDPL